MSRLRILLSLFCLMTFMSCMEEDLNKISNDVQLDADIAIPLIQSTTTLGDLLPEDENLNIEEDGYIKIAYREESIATIESDSLLQIEDQTPTQNNFEVGVISLSDINHQQRILLTELVGNLDDQSIAQVIDDAFEYAANNNNKAPFPDIDRQSGGSYSQTATDQFSHITMSEGNLSIEVVNNFGVSIDYLQLQLKNNDVSNQSQIGEFIFEDISPNSSQSSSITLTNKKMYNNLSFDVVAVEIKGTGPNVFDVSTHVDIGSTDDILINVNGTNISVTEGDVKFPEQEGPSDTFELDLEFEDDVLIDVIYLSGGALEYTYQSSINTVLELDIEISQLKTPSGDSFKTTIQVLNTGSGISSTSIPLENYRFDFEGQQNKLDINYSSKIKSSNTYSSFNQDDFVNLTIGVVDLDFSKIEGYFGQINESIDSDALDVDVSVLGDIASGIKLETPALTFVVDNETGIPFEIDLDLEGFKGSESVNLEGPKMNIKASDISEVTYDATNSKLSELVALTPSTIIYSGSVTSNPLGNTEAKNSISPGQKINIGFEMDLPLYLRIDDAITSDTIALDFADSDEKPSDNIERVSFKMNVQNEFPLNVDLKIYLADSISGSVLDSLEFDLLEAAEVDENGKTLAPKNYTTTFELDSDQVDALNDANQALLDIRMNSYDVENRAVKLYADYEFVIKAGVILQLNIED